MRERLFPRWCTALFTLLPMSELLYLPADGQSVYAAALACTVCALAGIGAARLSDRVRHSAPAQWVLALTSLFPLLASIARMSIFLQKTVFTGRSCGSTVVLLTVCILLMAAMGLNRCAMWALPIAWLAGTVLLLSGVLTFTQLTPASFSAPTAALLPQFWHILYSLLLGANTAALLPYPAFTAAGLAAIGNFARHGEVFFAVPLLLCEVGRCAALVCVLLYPFTRTCGVLHLRRPQ